MNEIKESNQERDEYKTPHILQHIDWMAEQKQHCRVFEELGFDDNDYKKFAKVVKYVEDLDLQDLKLVTDDEFYEVAKHEDRLVMTLFAKRVSDFFKQKKLFDNLTLRVNAVSWRFAEFASKTRVSSKELTGYLQEHKQREFFLIDFSSNDLGDDDLPFICSALDDTDLRSKILDLSNNRFGLGSVNVNEDLSTLISKLLEKFEFVDFSGCPLSSIDHSAFLTHIAAGNKRDNFVWIPKHFLEARIWKKCINVDDDVVEMVYKAHRKYYFQRSQ
jgi:hypothetical protein